ncbi:MAG: 50S ribosomal protein L25/general stress protein Ctc [Proteobacteria bacterium]|nr:50S ribosomal protein L25/general stress protein Ctc [Pseudomonadota bacterium]
MSDVASLDAEAREQAGKGAARALRRSGRVPAVIYGDKKDPPPISIDGHSLQIELSQAGFYLRLYDIKVNGKNERVLPRDVQRHPVTSVPLHVDFLRISAGATIAVNVGVVFENEELSPGLKRGGVLNVVRYEIELVCPAAAIPEQIVIDLTGLDIGDGIHISNVKLPPDVEPVIADRDFTIATIASPTVQEEEVEEEEGEEIEGEEGLEVEGEEGESSDGEGAGGGENE